MLAMPLRSNGLRSLSESGLIRTITDSTQPLRILVCSIEVVRSFVAFELAFSGRHGSLREQSRDFGLAQWLETARSIERLPKNLQRITSSNHHARGQVHGVMQAFYRGCSLAV